MTDSFSLTVQSVIDRFGHLNRDPISGLYTYSMCVGDGLSKLDAAEHFVANDLLRSRSTQAPFPAGRLLSSWILQHPEEVKNKMVLDVGSGSGIVAIAAAKAGADHVFALDFDPIAEEVIKQNAMANNVSNITTINGNALDESLYNGIDIITAADTFTSDESEKMEKRLVMEFMKGKTVIAGSNLENIGLLARQRQGQLLHPEREAEFPQRGTYLLLKPAA